MRQRKNLCSNICQSNTPSVTSQPIKLSPLLPPTISVLTQGLEFQKTAGDSLGRNNTHRPAAIYNKPRCDSVGWHLCSQRQTKAESIVYIHRPSTFVQNGAFDPRAVP
ncbi:Hypothetical predicted protein [Pelobates cultripes]|uniref:Uncharacterized protein n=1 Tax=Pelobates cultripes TaxID=61616 RepID=A0AAD1VRU4_PELCU|nr:Hypothetical predicted protein [Pelobates cultripes]